MEGISIIVACKQALWGSLAVGQEKEGELRLWNLNICMEKVNAKCWLAEMTLVRTSLPLALVFQCLFTFMLVSTSRWLEEIWQLSRREATGEMEVEFKFQSNSCELSFLCPPFLPPAPTRALPRACYYYWLLNYLDSSQSSIFPYDRRDQALCVTGCHLAWVSKWLRGRGRFGRKREK